MTEKPVNLNFEREVRKVMKKGGISRTSAEAVVEKLAYDERIRMGIHKEFSSVYGGRKKTPKELQAEWDSNEKFD